MLFLPARPSARSCCAPALLLLAFASSAGCVDYGLKKPDDDEVGADGGASDDGGAPGDSGVPGTCDPVILAPEVSVNESCIRDVETVPLDPVEEWSVEVFPNYPEYDQIVMAPVVGPLFDSSGDGVVDGSDQPSVVVMTDDDGDNAGKHGILRILDGRDGSAQVDITQVMDGERQVFPYRYSNVALGDVDLDGVPEVVTVVEVLGDSPGDPDPDSGGSGEDTAPPGGGTDSGETGDPGDTDNPIILLPPSLPSPPPVAPQPDNRCYVAAFDPAGDMDWIGDAVFDCAGHAPAIADMDGDGQPEVTLGKMIFDGATGTLRGEGSYDEGRYYAYAEMGTHSVVADLDVDGQQELIAGRSVYRIDGSLICSGSGPNDGFAAVADFDLDGQGEFLVVGDHNVNLYDTDCSNLRHWLLPDSGNGGPPAIGDLDGDGRPEIALPSATAYTAYEMDGTIIWSMPVSDVSSHATGSLIFDFENDGYPEVVYADEVALHIFDGRTGEERYTDDAHSSRTLHDYPTVADVDKDGHAEVIVPNGGGHYDESRRGLYVLGSESNAWQAARPVWNQHAYSITNVENDLTIPASPEPNWISHNNFRSGDPMPADDGRWPDAVPVAEVCTADCDDGVLVVDIAIANQGAGGLRADIPLTAWIERGDGSRISLAEEWTTAIVDEGAVSSTWRLQINADDLTRGTLKIGADLDERLVGYADECDETNNVLVLADAACP